MARAKKPAQKKVDEKATAVDEPKAVEPLAPQKVQELFGLPGPYDQPPPPARVTGFVTFWDPGVSIRTLVAKYRALFALKEFSGRFAADTDAWWWKQIKLRAVEPGQAFAEQRKRLLLGAPPAAREVVTFSSCTSWRPASASKPRGCGARTWWSRAAGCSSGRSVSTAWTSRM